jgi:hypothetical protein
MRTNVRERLETDGLFRPSATLAFLVAASAAERLTLVQRLVFVASPAELCATVSCCKWS